MSAYRVVVEKNGVVVSSVEVVKSGGFDLGEGIGWTEGVDDRDFEEELSALLARHAVSDRRIKRGVVGKHARRVSRR